MFQIKIKDTFELELTKLEPYILLLTLFAKLNFSNISFTQSTSALNMLSPLKLF